MKKLFALILAMAMVLALLVGCGSTSASEKGNNGPSETENGTSDFTVGRRLWKRHVKRRVGSTYVSTPVTTQKKLSTTATT